MFKVKSLMKEAMKLFFYFLFLRRVKVEVMPVRYVTGRKMLFSRDFQIFYEVSSEKAGIKFWQL